MSFLPARRPADPTEVEPSPGALRAQQRTEDALFKASLSARLLAETERLESQAAGDALRYALDEELSLLQHGIDRAGGSPAKVELVARKVEMLSATNNRRFSRRFGG